MKKQFKPYLTEEKLKWFCEEIFDNCNVIFENQFNVLGKKYRLDIFIKDLNLAIEFDGYRHYSDFRTQHRDTLLDTYLNDNNISVIRIPYFVQLDDIIIDFYFSEYLNYMNLDKWEKIKDKFNYPHGFIDDKAMLPIDFNYFGRNRFIKEINALSSSVADDILDSFFSKVENIVKDLDLTENILDLFFNVNEQIKN